MHSYSQEYGETKINKILTLLLQVLIFLSTFSVYLHNLSPSVYGGDSGDFLSAIVVKGVAHPSGYPLFTLLGILFSYLPFHQTLAWKVNLLSAIFTSLTNVLMFIFVYRISKNRILALISAFSYAFIFPIFLYAEVTEVFALHYFLLLIDFYLAYLFFDKQKIIYLYLFSIFLGLSFANNELILLILPACAFFIIQGVTKAFKNKFLFKDLIFAFFLFLLGLTPYIYIPIAASSNPPVNWDNASNLHNFIQLVTRKDYGWGGDQLSNSPIYLPDRLESVKRYFSYWFSVFPPIIFISILGFVFLILKKKFKLLTGLLIAYFINGPLMLFYYAPASVSPYSLGIYERYYGLSGSFMFILLPFGICLITEFIYLFIKKPLFINLITISFLVIPAYLLILNYPRTDLHNNWIGDKFAKDILSSLPKNSILLVNNEDNVIFNSLYIQHAQNFRKDIKITSAHTLKSIPLLGAYLNQHKNNSMFTTSFTYAYWNWSPVAVVPQGLVLKFVMPNDKMTLDSKDFFLNNQKDLLNKLSSGLPENKNISHLLYLTEIPGYYAMAYINTADYILYRSKDSENAKELLLNAISIYPNLPEHYLMLASYYYENNDCRKTGKLLNKIETLPYIISTETIPYVNKYGGFLVEAQKKCHGFVKNPFGPNGWSVY